MAAAACCQYKAINDGIKIRLVTTGTMEPVLRWNPWVEWGDHVNSDEVIHLQWASQYKENIWHLHIKQKYSYQMGFFIDPTYTVSIFDDNGVEMKNDPNEGYDVLINTMSSLPSKRWIPDYIVGTIIDECEGADFNVKFVGSHTDDRTTKDIDLCIQLMRKAHLYIGPISGMAYLAEAMKMERMIFCSSVPYYKDMSFDKLTPIMQNEPCILDCEHSRFKNDKEEEMYEEMGCGAIDCKATFTESQIVTRLRELL